MSRANDLFDTIADGPKGEVVLTADDIAEIDRSALNPVAIEAKLSQAISTRPGFQVQITDAPGGGLRIRWRTR